MESAKSSDRGRNSTVCFHTETQKNPAAATSCTIAYDRLVSKKRTLSILQSQGSGKPFFIKPIRILVTYKKRTLSISDLDGSGKPCPSIRLTSSNIQEEDAVDFIP